MNTHFYVTEFKRYLASLGRNPELDWRVLFILFIVLSFCVLAFNGVMLYRINAGEIFLAEKKDSQAVRTIDRAKLKALTDQFNASDRRFEDLKVRKPALVDPGL